MSDAHKPSKEDMLRAAIRQVEQEIAARWTPSAARMSMATGMRHQFAAAVSASGGNPTHPDVMRQMDILESLYLTIATIVDHCPEWQDGCVGDQRAGELLNEWLGRAIKALRDVSPAHG